MPEPIPFFATYRLQLRNGVDLDRARDLLPWLSELGISHLYLSPPFHAASGSTHGYDVIDPTRIDPAIGGNDAFIRLSDAARAAGIGIVIDIVPNHMAFTPENPWLADVLRHGRNSAHAPIFDIDWDSGCLHFPVLDASAGELLAQGQIAFAGDLADPRLRVYEREYPLRSGHLAQTLARDPRALDEATLQELLAQQHWSLGHWHDSADAIIHRRFFNIIDLIGVQQEDPQVFALTHAWIIENLAAGRIQGLRVDHIDGLARPGSYLHRLRAAVGDTPIWVEKIVKDGEEIPSPWPVEGMSGYEFMAPVTRLLLRSDGMEAMREAARGAVPASYQQEVRAVRRQLLAETFRPEMRRITAAARNALALGEEQDNAISAAIARLAIEWPVYRSYTADHEPFSALVAQRLDSLDQKDHVAALIGLLRAADDPLALAFAARFEQLTGALTAKSEEDTVFYRSVAVLPLCEVGAEPDLVAINVPHFEDAMTARARLTPLALNALSTHDTKRSADARAILVALSRYPKVVAKLYDAARHKARQAGLPEKWGIYAAQIALIMQGERDASERIAAHIAKAMREGKELSTHEAPDTAAESNVADLAGALHAGLREDIIDQAPGFDAMVEEVILTQAFFQMAAPGVPDIYQGSEGVALSLTDPDNRLPVDWDALAKGDLSPLSRRKLRLTQQLLAARRSDPELFTAGDFSVSQEGKMWRVERTLPNRQIALEFDPAKEDANVLVTSAPTHLVPDGA